MKITNTQVQYLYNWLNAPLHGEQSRSRNKFVKLITKQYNDSINGRTDILKSFADKDKKTKQPIIENGLYKMSDAKLVKAKEEVTEFLNESVEYTIAKSDKAIIRSIIEILNNAKLPLDIPTGQVYEEVMSELESVK